MAQEALRVNGGYVIAKASLQDALMRHLDHQRMMIAVGKRRQPDKQSDLVEITVTKNGEPTPGWKVKDVKTNSHGLGRTVILLVREDASGYPQQNVKLHYTAHTEELFEMDFISQ